MKFNTAVKKYANKINYKDVFIFGIKPKEPSDQYGYFTRKNNSIEVSNFIEKPNKLVAKKLIKKEALWNAGIFLSTKENPLSSRQCNALMSINSMVRKLA